MEFKLEDFDNQQKAAFDFDDENNKEKTLGEKDRRWKNRKKQDNQLKKYILSCTKNYNFYKFFILPIFLIFFAFIFQSFFEKLSKSYLEKSILSQERIKNEHNDKQFQLKNTHYYNSPHNIQSERIILPERQVVKTKKNGNGQVVYSWTDENGKKVFSNIGFPENKKYTDGKIEWY